MPSRKASDGEYRDIAHPINSDTRQKIQQLILDAYKKADLEGWAAAEERAKQKAADTPAEEGLPLFSEDSFNYSVIGEHAQTWEKYVKEGRTFRGRDDGKMRAELDSNRFKFYFNDKSKPEISDSSLHELAQKAIVNALATIEKLKITGLRELEEALKNEIDKTTYGIYPDLSEILNYYMGSSSFNAEDAMAFVRKQQPYEINRHEEPIRKLSDILHADELYAAYPELKEMLVVEKDIADTNRRGGSNGYKIHINANLPEKQKEKTLLHEVQHIIQRIEGFARGANSKNSYHQFQKAYRAFKQSLRRGDSLWPGGEQMAEKTALAFRHIEKLAKRGQKISYRLLNDATWGLFPKVLDNYDLYERSAGEIEARNVAKRIALDETERALIYHNDSEKSIRGD